MYFTRQSDAYITTVTMQVTCFAFIECYILLEVSASQRTAMLRAVLAIAFDNDDDEIAYFSVR